MIFTIGIVVMGSAEAENFSSFSLLTVFFTAKCLAISGVYCYYLCMVERKPQLMPDGGTLLDKGSKLVMLLFACASSFVVIGVVWWKGKQDENVEQDRQRKAMHSHYLTDRLNSINSFAEKSVTQEKGIVVFENGTMVAVPANREDYAELATAALKLLPQMHIDFQIVKQENGDWLCELGGPVQTYGFASEIEAMGAEEVTLMLKKNVLLDRAEAKISHYHPAKK